MINPNERNINLLWHNLREEDEYLEPISQLQQIQIKTSINNVYRYVRAMDESATPPTRYDDRWEVEKNGQPLYVLDNNGNPTNERVIKTFTTFTPLLSEFYNIYKPGTLIPVEVPTEVIIN